MQKEETGKKETFMLSLKIRTRDLDHVLEHLLSVLFSSLSFYDLARSEAIFVGILGNI